MKPFIYVAIFLMAGAAAYGIADYKRASSGGEFNELYHEPHSKSETPKKSITSERSAEPMDVEKIEKPDKKTRSVKRVQSEPASDSRQLKTEKKLDAELFSRAPLKQLPYPAEKENNHSKKQD